jgi:AcrR family transcriptional regulator
MPRRPKVSVEQIVVAAIRLADREGAGALTMDRIGAELGVAAMSLYNHVANKEALLDAIAEAMLREIAVPPAADWETLVREGFRSVRRVAHRHRALFPLVLDRVPHLLGEARLIEQFLEVMCAAGFDVRTALGAFRVLSNFTIGYALAEARGFALEPGRSGLDAAALPAEVFPQLARLAPHLGESDRDADFEFGLELILTGLRAELRQRGQRADT